MEDALLEQAKREAGRRGQTLTWMLEQGLRLMLAQSGKRLPRRRVRLPLCRAGGGTLPGVELENSAALLDRMEGRR